MTREQSLDAELLAAVPDAGAVRALYERHVDAVFHFAVRRCGNPEDVADLGSAVFLELFSAAGSYDRRRGEVRVWLLGIAARCLADQHRSNYRRAELAARLGAAPQLCGEEHERVEAIIDAARLAPAAERALAEQLTEAERGAFLLVARDGLRVADAARSLGLTPVAGRMRFARARRKLRAAIEANGPAHPRPGDERRPETVPAEEKP